MKPPSATPVPPDFATAGEFMEAFARDVGGLICYCDAEERIQYASRALGDWVGKAPEDIIGKSLKELYGAEVYAEFGARVKQALAGEDVHYERLARHPGGPPVWIAVNLRPHRDASGRVIGLFSCALYVEELKRTHDALGRALEELASQIENTPLGVVEWSADICVRRWSPQAEAIFGYGVDEVLGKRSSEIGLVHADSLETVRSLTRELIDGRARRNPMLAPNITKHRRTLCCQWSNSAFFDQTGKLASILSLAEDVTARVDAEEQLQQAAVNDALTRLPNRNSLAARLEHAILRVNRSGDRLALLFIDLDRFKRVNDTLGHAAGDEVLRQAAARIRACVREVDSVARLGGDEFVVLLETDVRPDTPGIIGERVRAAVRSPFDL